MICTDVNDALHIERQGLYVYCFSCHLASLIFLISTETAIQHFAVTDIYCLCGCIVDGKIFQYSKATTLFPIQISSGDGGDTHFHQKQSVRCQLSEIRFHCQSSNPIAGSGVRLFEFRVGHQSRGGSSLGRRKQWRN